MRCSAVQWGAVRCSAVQCGAVGRSAVKKKARASFLAEVANVRKIKSAKAVARFAAKAVARPAGK